MRSALGKVWDRTALVLGTGFGFGYVPFVPGTVGTLWGLPLVWALQNSGLPLIVQLLIVAVLFLVGIPICSHAAKLMGKEDPGQVVFDEIAALPVVFLVTNTPVFLVTDTGLDLTTGIAGFLWFRFFDILKPWPVRRFDQWHGGLGIMTDDIAAALYAAAALWLTVKMV